LASITNITGISLPLAVWLAADEYDYYTGTERSISATSLIKPTRQIILRERLDEENQETPDVSDRIASRLGNAIHDSIERAWKTKAALSLQALGYPEHVLKRIAVNPEAVTPGMIPIYMEQRESRIFRGYRISGKFDFVLDGELQDFKSTSVYSFILGDKDEIYRLQGSIYRWLNPTKITHDYMNIQFIFTDWSRAMAARNSEYPQQRVHTHRVTLMSIAETEDWLNAKIDALESVAHLPEDQLPFCTDADLWRSAPKWKYYSDPAKTSGKSTKNFDSAAEADAHLKAAGKGIVIEIPGQVKACGYCPAFNICTQKDNYEHA
jgi:hypothetical protein